MASYSVNPAAVAHARELIDARQYVLDSDWGEAQPKADDENAFLESHSWDEYAAWHLGLTEGANDETKARYAFVYGDFRRLHRTGLIACVYRPPSGATRRSSSRPTSCCSTWTRSAADPPGCSAHVDVTHPLPSQCRVRTTIHGQGRRRTPTRRVRAGAPSRC